MTPVLQHSFWAPEGGQTPPVQFSPGLQMLRWGGHPPSPLHGTKKPQPQHNIDPPTPLVRYKCRLGPRSGAFLAVFGCDFEVIMLSSEIIQLYSV